MGALFIFIYISLAFYGLFIHRAYKADLQVSFQRSLLFGFSEVDIKEEEDEYTIFQVALAFVVFTMTYERRL